MIDAVILAEFDISSGNIIRLQYPRELEGVDPEDIAPMMIPDGAHNTEHDITTFILRRNQKENVEEEKDANNLSDIKILSNRNFREPKINLLKHTGITLQKSPVRSLSDSPDSHKDRFREKQGEISDYVESINSNNDTYFFVSVLRNKRDLSYARGSIVKAMSIASKYRYVEAFNGLLDRALNDYLDAFRVGEDQSDSEEKAEAIMGELYQRINEECNISRFNKANFFEKRVYNDIRAYCDDKNRSKLSSFYYSKNIEWNGSSVRVKLPKALDCDKLSNCTNLKSFVLKFGERVMLIFNNILLEKRVMFIGNKHSSKVMSEYVYTCLEMFTPPMIGLLYRALPFITLNSINLLQIPGYIAGTNNVLFETKTAYYDLACEIESSKIKISREGEEDDFIHPDDESHHECDLNFIRRLINRIKTKAIYDYEIKDYFASYLQTLLDLALSSDPVSDYPHNKVLQEFADQNSRRISLFKKTSLFRIYKNIQNFMGYEVRSGISMFKLEENVRRLRFSASMSEELLRSIFMDFKEFLTPADHDRIIRFLYLFPRHKGGLSVLASAIFGQDEQVVKYAKECLEVLDDHPVGKKYIGQLSFVVQNKFRE
ncbi:unnamed protein product [Moneuplotes crassus]|uniref:UDENN domain-containing protein n=2 Tax=Euplotes crassus TaxID=5936 RepID=A0AAD1U505_EUPCR|nr:unnamed protein product [Moneuplotes crassus]